MYQVMHQVMHQVIPRVLALLLVIETRLFSVYVAISHLLSLVKMALSRAKIHVWTFYDPQLLFTITKMPIHFCFEGWFESDLHKTCVKYYSVN